MLTVTQMSRKAKIAPNTVRNYIRAYPDLFSDHARGLQGNRRFTDDDVEAICSLVALKDSGIPLAEAADRLRSQEAPPVIDVAATTLQEGFKDAPESTFALQAVQSGLEAKIDALERRQDTLLRAAALWGALLGSIVTLAAAAFVVWVLWLMSF